MTLTVFWARGIGEFVGEGMGSGNPPSRANGYKRIPGLREYLREGIKFVEIPWNATYGPAGGGFFGTDYDSNLAEGMIIVRDYIERFSRGNNDRFVLSGYSAGATLMGDYTALATPIMGADRIAACALVADPKRPLGGGMEGYAAPHWGIGGERPTPGHIPTWWASDPRDPITSLEPNSPLRTFADQTWAASFAPGEFPEWMRDLADRVTKNRWQAVQINWLDPIGTFRLYQRAADAASRYLFQGDHGMYAVRDYPQDFHGLPAPREGGASYLQVLARKINRLDEDYR